MKKVIKCFLYGFISIASANAFAFGALENIRLYTAKGAYLAIYDPTDHKNIAASFPKGAEFIGHTFSGGQPGYRFLMSRKYNIVGDAKETDIIQLPLPQNKADLFQLLLDDYNKVQNILLGGVFAALSMRNVDQSRIDLSVHQNFITADDATKKEYARDMYNLWKECNPTLPHLTVNFIERKMSGSDKLILSITDGVISNTRSEQ